MSKQKQENAFSILMKNSTKTKLSAPPQQKRPREPENEKIADMQPVTHKKSKTNTGEANNNLWSISHSNRFVSKLNPDFFLNTGPNINHYRRWRRPPIFIEEKLSIASPENSMRLVVIGCISSYEEIPVIKRRLNSEINFFSPLNRNKEIPSLHKNNGKTILGQIIEKTASRLNDINTLPNLDNNESDFESQKKNRNNNFYKKNNTNNSAWASRNRQVPIVHLFCHDKNGRSYCINSHGFFPYIYCEVPKSVIKIATTDDISQWSQEFKSLMCESFALSIDAHYDKMNFKGTKNSSDSLSKQQDMEKFTSELYSNMEQEAFGSFIDNSDTTSQTTEFMQKAIFKSPTVKSIKQSNVVKIDIVMRMPFDGADKESIPMFRIYFRNPSIINSFRPILTEQGFTFSTSINNKFTNHLVQSLPYDACLRFENRFLIDSGLHGGCWFDIPAHSEKQVRFYDDEECYQKSGKIAKQETCISRCQVEIDIHWSSIVFLDQDDAKNNDIYSAQLEHVRILSFDIECIGNNYRFPIAQLDPSVCINVYATKDSRYPKKFLTKQEDYKDKNETDKILSVCFAVSSSNFEPGNKQKQVLRGYADKEPVVFSFATENEMFNAFRDFVTVFDPDVITGYNTSNFDIPMILDRSDALMMENFGNFARLIYEKCSYKQISKSNKKKGSSSAKVISNPGRLSWDTYPYIYETVKLPSYTLNAVATELFKGETKDDVDHLALPKLYATGPENRDIVRMYCEKDAVLALSIFNLKQVWNSRLEECRRLGIRLEQGEGDGRAAKLFPFLTRLSNKDANHLVIPYRNLHDVEREPYKGALIQKPIVGFHVDRLKLLLDYTSMYPSIVIAYNLCMSTYIHPDKLNEIVRKYGQNCYHTVPFEGHKFLKKEFREGILPKAVKFLLDKRVEVKDSLALIKDIISDIYTVLNVRQNQLKISANSMYGITGVPNNGIFWVEVGASVTAHAREQITQTVSIIKEERPDVEIIYGDTDSLFIQFTDPRKSYLVHKGMKQEERLEQEKAIFEEGKRLCTIVTSRMPKPSSLALEFIISNFILCTMKKYSCQTQTKPGDPLKEKTMGLDCERRSSCSFTRLAQKKLLNILMTEQDVEAALKFCEERTIKLATGDINPADLILTSRLNKAPTELRDTTTVRPQEYLFQRMNELDENNVPNLGDRVSYMIRAPDQNRKKQKNFKKAIHPSELIGDYAQQLDFTYYFEKQFLNSMLILLDTVTKESFHQSSVRDYTDGIMVYDEAKKQELREKSKKKSDKVGMSSAEKRLRKCFNDHFVKKSINDSFWIPKDSEIHEAIRMELDITNKAPKKDTSGSSTINDISVDEPMFKFDRKETALNKSEITSMGTKDIRFMAIRIPICIECSQSMPQLAKNKMYGLCINCVSKYTDKHFESKDWKWQYVQLSNKNSKHKKPVRLVQQCLQEEVEKLNGIKRKSVTGETQNGKKNMCSDCLSGKLKPLGCKDTKCQNWVARRASKIIIEYSKESLINLYESKKKETKEKWDICKKCMGEKFDEDNCANYTCFNWFIRSTTKQEFTSLAQTKLDLGF